MTVSPMIIRSNGFSSTRNGIVVLPFWGTRAKSPSTFSMHHLPEYAASEAP
jgi:hypothetical protein